MRDRDEIRRGLRPHDLLKPLLLLNFHFNIASHCDPKE